MPNFINKASSAGSGGAPQSDANFKSVHPDSVPIHYFYSDNPEQWFSFSDTLLTQFHQYDPARQVNYFDYINLGDIGLPARPLLYQPIIREGFHVGFNQYRLYEWQKEKVRFFHNPKPYTEAQYTQSNSQDEFTLDALASIKLGKKINFAADFRRIRQNGVYQRQGLKHGNLELTAWYESKDKRHKAYFSYLTNNFFQQQNGGVSEVTTIGEGGIFASRSQLSVNLSAAETTHEQDVFSLTNYFSLSRQKRPRPIIDTIPRSLDSSSFRPIEPKKPVISTPQKKKANLFVMHRLAYETASFKFFDTAPPADSAVYGDFMVDERGLRHYVAYRAIENTLKIRLAYMGNLDVGIRHKLFFVDQEPQDTTINNLFLTGDWQLDIPNDNFGLNVKARLGLLDNGADYLLDANAFLNIKKIGRLDAQLISQRYSPSLIQHRTYISKQEIWNNDFSKPIETSLIARLFIPKTKTTVHFQNHLINNLIYMDSLGLPRQESRAVNILQFLVSQNFKFKAFHFDNTVGFQQVSNSEVLRYPSLVSKHSLYFEGFIFKRAALVKLGMDIRYNSSYYADDFQPATGQFFLQNHTNISPLPIVDFFFSTKVQTFRLFAKVENANELIFNETVEDFVDTNLASWNFNPNYYTLVAPQYPMRSWTVRLGVHWRFYD
jgi:hypothetical protein